MKTQITLALLSYDLLGLIYYLSIKNDDLN